VGRLLDYSLRRCRRDCETCQIGRLLDYYLFIYATTNNMYHFRAVARILCLLRQKESDSAQSVPKFFKYLLWKYVGG
jgi:hypothetical protein